MSGNAAQLEEIRREIQAIKAQGGGVTAKDSTRRLLIALAIYVAVLAGILCAFLSR